MRKRFLMAVTASFCAFGAVAAQEIAYLDWDEASKTMARATCTAYEVVTDGIDTFEAGKTYVVNDWISAEKRIVVNGTAEQPTYLVLCDDGWLTAKVGIEVATGRKLVICEQAEGDEAAIRQLTANGTDQCAGIGGNWNVDCGAVVINGGTVNVRGGNQAAGIGGGFYGAGGDVTVNGGIVNAWGGTNGAGIGGGNNGSGGVVTVRGGMVSCYGGSGAAGIGGGWNGGGATVSVNGGMVTALGDNGCAGIGAGGSEGLIDSGSVTFGPGMTYFIIAGPNMFDSTVVTKEEYAANHSATYVYIDAWPGSDEPPSVPMGRYCNLDLAWDLGIEIPFDVDYGIGDKVKVKIEGLAKGLKLISTPVVYEDPDAKKVFVDYIYAIEGVPTETIDFAKRPMYARVTTTYKDKTKGEKGKVETLQPIALSITPAPAQRFPDAFLGGNYVTSVKDLWPDADATWSFKGWPAGLKYTTKYVTTKNKDKSVTTNALPFEVYGMPTKAGVFTITASHPKTLGKTKYTETETATLIVWGDSETTDFRYIDQAHVATATKKLDATWKKFSGLPAGIKWTTKDVTTKSKDKVVTTIADAYSFYGTPTKPGVFAVKATKVDPTDAQGKRTVTETFLWAVLEGENDGVLDRIDWNVKDSAVTVVRGDFQNWGVSIPDDAKVTVSGLPSGLKFAQDKNTKIWSISGTPTKVGNFIVTFKTVRNGVTVNERIAIIVGVDE